MGSGSLVIVSDTQAPKVTVRASGGQMKMRGRGSIPQQLTVRL